MTRSEAGRLGGLKTFKFLVAATKAKHEKALTDWSTRKPTCKECFKSLPFEQRSNTYCSSRCSALAINRQRVRKPRICITCGSSWYRDKGTHSKRCLICRNPDLRATPVTSASSAPRIKRYLIKSRGRCCERCLNTVWCDVPIPLELEHVDGNSLNNDFNNLKLLCPNCHALTPTYKSKNRGRGRFSRRMRYQQNLSY